MSDKGVVGKEGKPKAVNTSEEVRGICIPTISDGMIVRGIVKGRRRTAVKMKDESVRYPISLVIEHSRGTTRVELWSDTPSPVGLPVVGEECEIPVDVRVFNSKAGPQYRISVAGEDRGESF